MKRRVPRLAFQSVTILLLIGTALLVLGPVRQEISRRIELLRTEAVGRVESILGRRVSYQSISPSILNFLNIRGLVVHGRQGEAEDLLEVDRLRLYYRPLRLLRGEFTNAFSQVRIENSAVLIDLREEEAIALALSDAFDQGGGTSAALPDGLSLRGQNLRVTIISESGEYSVDELFFDTELSDGVLTFDSRGEFAVAEVPFAVRNAQGRYSGAGFVDLRTGETLAELGLSRVSTDLAELSEIVLQVRVTQDLFEVRNVQSRDPIDIYVRQQRDGSELYARLLADGYVASSLIEFRGALAALNPFLGVPFQGQASITVNETGASYGASLSSGVAEVAGLPGGRFSVRVSGDEQELSVDRFEFLSGGGRLWYEGSIGLDPLLPRGTLTLNEFQFRDTDPVSTQFRFVPSPSGFTMDADPFELGATQFEQISWGVEYSDRIRSTLSLATGRRSQSRFALDTTHELDWSVRDVSVQSENFDIAAVAQTAFAIAPGLVPGVFAAIPRSLRLSTRAELSQDGATVASLPQFLLFDQSNPTQSLSLVARYQDDSLVVSAIEGRLEQQTLTGRVELSLVSEQNVLVAGNFDLSGTEYEFSGELSDRRVELVGSRGSVATVRFPADAPTVFSVNGELPLPSQAEGGGLLRIAGDGFFNSSAAWQIDVERFELEGITIGPLESDSIAVSGRFTESGASIERLVYKDAYSRLSGDASASWDLSTPTARVDLSVFPVGENGAPIDDPDESYSLSGQLSGGELRAQALFAGVPLARIGMDAVRGAATVEASATGTLTNPELTALVTLQDARFNNDPVELSLEVNYSDEALQVGSGQARVGRTRVENLSGTVDLASAKARFGGQILQINDRETIVITVAADGEFAELSGLSDVVSSPVRGTISVEGLPSEQGQTNWLLSFDRTDEVTSISGGPDEAIALSIFSDGAFEGSIGGTLPVSFRVIGYLEAGLIEADLIDVQADLQSVWALLNLDSVDFSAGAGQGSLRIVGPVNDPDFFGTLVVTDVTGSVEWVPEAMGPGRTFIVFDEKTLTVRETRMPIGDAAARIGATVTLDRWGVEEYRVSVTTVAGSSLPIVTTFDRIEIDGQAAGDLEIRGGPVSTAITGNLTASNTTVTLGPVIETPPAANDEIDITVDVTLETGRGLEFLWPTAAFPILRGFSDTEDRVRIVLDSGGGSFGVDGEIGIQGGEIFYFDRSFYITQGAIAFAEDEAGFDPRLSVTAEIREISDEGPITIFLIAEERPLSEFTPQWRSSPPLSEAAILALLGGTVFVGQGGEPIDLSQAVLLTSDLVSQFGLIRTFESNVRSALNLDLFSLRTQLFQNLLRGVIDQNGSVPLDSTVPSLGEYLDNTTLFAGRYLGADLFLELLIQVRQSEADVLGQQSLTGIEIDSEISLEWDTPFFQLEWAFFPRDVSTLFLADNTIRFSWDYSY